MAVDGDESGRNISRGRAAGSRRARRAQGFNTITGGKLMTYRLMAEWATDACQKFGNSKPCRTAELSLPGSRDPEKVSAPVSRSRLKARPSTVTASGSSPFSATIPR